MGTTVRITDFLKRIPVRRQTVLKGAAKTLTRIKKLLQSYAISQPSKRLSLKVLKANNENNNWSYAPSADPSLLDAALKVVGTEISSSCVLRSLFSQGASRKERGSLDRKEYEAVAFLPNSQFGEPAMQIYYTQPLINPDTSKIDNTGQFISVDGRPMSSNRGIGHEIAKIFKRYIRIAASKIETCKSVSDPFLCLHILCPRGTYDVNIEPAKDDILFEDRELVLALVEELFREHYGQLDGAEKSPSKQGKENASTCDQVSGGFDLLMARKPAAELATPSRDPGNPFRNTIPNTPLSQRPSRSENEISPPEIPSSVVPETPDPSDATRAKRSSFVNPWSISRINASFQAPRRERVSLVSSSPMDLSGGSLQGPMRRHSESRSPQHSPNSSDLPSPHTSRFAFGSPVIHRRQQEEGSLSSSPGTNRMSIGRRAERERDRERYGNGALDTWFQRTTQVSLQQTPLEDNPSQNQSELPRCSSLAQERFGSPTKVSQDGGHHDEQNDGCSEPSSNRGSPQQSDRHDSLTPDGEDDHIPVSMDSGRGFPVLERWAAQLHGDSGHEEPTDLEKALDFEKRKKEAIQSRRLQIKNGETPSSSHRAPISHPTHSSRYLAAKAALTSSQTSVGEPVSTTRLSPHDPRAYLMRQREVLSIDESSMNDPKARRLLASRLPFERVPDGSDLHDLGITCSVDLSPESIFFKSCASEDLYIASGDEATAFSPSDVQNCLPLWNERLAVIMKQQYQPKGDSLLPSSTIDISSIISQHLKGFDAE